MGKPERVSFSDRLRIGADYNDGHLLKEIMDRYNIRSTATIISIAKRLGLPLRNVNAVLAFKMGRPPKAKPPMRKPEMSEVRQRAWETRRAYYGESGHSPGAHRGAVTIRPAPQDGHDA